MRSLDPRAALTLTAWLWTRAEAQERDEMQARALQAADALDQLVAAAGVPLPAGLQQLADLVRAGLAKAGPDAIDKALDVALAETRRALAAAEDHRRGRRGECHSPASDAAKPSEKFTGREAGPAIDERADLWRKRADLA